MAQLTTTDEARDRTNPDATTDELLKTRRRASRSRIEHRCRTVACRA